MESYKLTKDEIAFEKLWPMLSEYFDDVDKEILFLVFLKGSVEGIKQSKELMKERMS